MPCSAACRNTGRAAASSRIHGRQAGEPKVSVPRQMRDTSRPVAPSRTYCMNEKARGAWAPRAQLVDRLLRLHARCLEDAAVLGRVLANHLAHLGRGAT